MLQKHFCELTLQVTYVQRTSREYPKDEHLKDIQRISKEYKISREYPENIKYVENIQKM